MADSTIVFEATYDTFQEHCNAKIFKNIPDSNRSQLCAVIHSVPDSVRGPQLRSLVKQARKVAEEVFITHLATDMFHQLSGFRRNCPLWRLLILPWSSGTIIYLYSQYQYLEGSPVCFKRHTTVRVLPTGLCAR